jgi:prepilin-type N-terminal cleavage/methylation domain-containing protein
MISKHIRSSSAGKYGCFRLGQRVRPAGIPATGSVLPFHAGFTLIELILVMAILTIAVSITAPALANFFRGRTLDSEARRLLACTRQGQSRAVSEGVPAEMWFDSSRNAIGLEVDATYEPDRKAEEYLLDKAIQMKVVSLNIGASRASGSFGASSMAQKPVSMQSSHANLPKIRFLPDGSIGEESPQVVQLFGNEGASISLVLARSRLNYELLSGAN